MLAKKLMCAAGSDCSKSGMVICADAGGLWARPVAARW